MATKTAGTILVQYIAVRRDLISTLNWPTGALIAQACHASSAVLHIYRDDEHVQQYLKDIDHMRKIVVEVKNEEDLVQLSSSLQEGGVKYKLWVEQPENFPTCLAIKPYPKSEIQKYLKNFKLFS